MYGRRASQLLKELSSNETGQLTAFNTDMFGEVLKECNTHHLELQSLMRKIQEEGLDMQTTKNADHFGAVIHHLSLMRNKRCLMAYVYNRAEVIQSLRWKVGPVLPQEIQGKLNQSEREYFKNHSAALEAYMSELDLDLTVDGNVPVERIGGMDEMVIKDMVPPKDPYIRIRVLDDIGDDVLLDDRSHNFVRHSIHLLKRTDAEQYISQDKECDGYCLSTTIRDLWYSCVSILLHVITAETLCMPLVSKEILCFLYCASDGGACLQCIGLCTQVCCTLRSSSGCRER